MKNVLLATSALTLLAGAAVADVSVSGTGRFGVTSTGGVTTTQYRTRTTFTGSGETDGGLTFGSWLRIQAGNGTAGAVSGAGLWMSNGQATLSIGNITGAISMLGIWGGGMGFNQMGWTDVVTGFNHLTQTSGAAGANGVRVDLALGSATVSASGGNGNHTEFSVSTALGSANLGLGFDSGAGTTGGYTLTSSFNAGSVDIMANFGSYGANQNWVLAATYGMGGGSIYAYASSLAGASNFGLTYRHGLGGGANASIGINSAAGVVTTQAGVNLSF